MTENGERKTERLINEIPPNTMREKRKSKKETRLSSPRKYIEKEL